MEIILIIGHGSPSKDAGSVEGIAEKLHQLMHPGCDNNCVRTAYLQFNEPAVIDALGRAAADGAGRIIIHPYFLSSGIHVSKSIPEIIEQAKRDYPEVEFVYTKPLGTYDKMAEIILGKIKDAL